MHNTEALLLIGLSFIQVVLQLDGLDKVIHIDEVAIDLSNIVRVDSLTLPFRGEELFDRLDLFNREGPLEGLVKLRSLQVSSNELAQVHSLQDLHTLWDAAGTSLPWWSHLGRWLSLSLSLLNKEGIQSCIVRCRGLCGIVLTENDVGLDLSNVITDQRFRGSGCLSLIHS